MRLIILLALAVSACGAASSEITEQSGNSARARAIDGDTVSIDIRLRGADAFERRQLCATSDQGCWECGKAAQDYASRILKSSDAQISLSGEISYGRPIATVSVNGADLGEQMIEAGLAVPATDYLKNDPTRAGRYLAAYDRAVASREGAHGGSFIAPEDWRQGERLTCEATSR